MRPTPCGAGAGGRRRRARTCRRNRPTSSRSCSPGCSSTRSTSRAPWPILSGNGNSIRGGSRHCRKATSMKATARRSGGTFKHIVQVRDHQVTVDEPLESGGDDAGPIRRSCWPSAWPRARRSRWRCTPGARAGTSATSRSTSSTAPPSAAARPSSSSSCGARPPARGARRATQGDRRQVSGPPGARGRRHVPRAHRARRLAA